MIKATLSAAIATFVLASPVAAATAETASLGPLQVTLVDLDPNDGITPSWTFDPYVTFGDGSEIRWYVCFQRCMLDGTEGWAPFRPLEYESWPDSANDMRAEITGPDVAHGTSLSVVSVTSNEAADRLWLDYLAVGSASVGHSFELSANTAVIVTAQASISGWSETARSTSLAGAGLTFYNLGAAGVGYESLPTVDALESTVSGMGYESASFSASRVLTASFSNLSSATVRGQFGAYVRARAYITGVPEPGTSYLLLGGLGLLGGLIHWRRRIGLESKR